MQTTSRSVAGSRCLDSGAQADPKQPATLLNPPHVFCPSTFTPSLVPPKQERVAGGGGPVRPSADPLQCHSQSWKTGNYCWALCQFLSAETAAGDTGQSPQGSRRVFFFFFFLGLTMGRLVGQRAQGFSAATFYPAAGTSWSEA